MRRRLIVRARHGYRHVAEAAPAIRHCYAKISVAISHSLPVPSGNVAVYDETADIIRPRLWFADKLHRVWKMEFFPCSRIAQADRGVHPRGSRLVQRFTSGLWVPSLCREPKQTTHDHNYRRKDNAENTPGAAG